MDEDFAIPIGLQQAHDLRMAVRGIKRRELITYKNLNSIRLAQPPHHGRPRAQPYVLPSEYTPGYPQPSTTNQRRRLKGHRGNGSEQKPIQRKLPADKDGHVAMQPVGIWRGLDHSLANSFKGSYTGEKLRLIRAIKGVGRPWVTLLPSDPASRFYNPPSDAENSETTS